MMVDRPLLLGLLGASCLFLLTFVLRPGNFWLLMVGTTSLLALYAFLAGGRPVITFSRRELLIGFFSSLLLFGIFRVGHSVLGLLASPLGLSPLLKSSLDSVYADKVSLPPWAISLLLVVIASGEEIFWRGFVQKRLMGSLGLGRGTLLGAILYTGVHLPTANPLLLVAALVCGLFWGFLYSWRGKNLAAPLLSHVLWDPLVFVLFPFL